MSNGARDDGRTTRIHIARHGATEANVRRLRARGDALLLPEGRDQARRMAAAVRTLGIDVVWSSPLPRALETAELIASSRGLPVRVDDDLRDLEEGPWEGLADEEIARAYPVEHALWQTRPDLVRLPGRETLASLRGRIAAAVERIRLGGGTPLAVTHLGPMRAIWLRCGRFPPQHYGLFLADHCRLFELAWTESGCRFLPTDVDGG